MMLNEMVYWIWLAQRNGVGNADAARLLEFFPGGAMDIYAKTPAELATYNVCSQAFLKRLENRDLNAATKTLELCVLNGIEPISCFSPRYPKRLKKVYNKPIVLYVRGNIEGIDERFCISIVGTRDISAYGRRVTFDLTRRLIGYGAVVISGAAYGVDSVANNTAVYFKVPNVAVLGSGLNVAYPYENKNMLAWIGEHGMLISEYPPGTPPARQNFPHRNRIISGMADAVLVVEAGEKSGALITARCACDQERVLYAVPGNIGASNSLGTNKMIRDGAKLVLCAEDIIEDFQNIYDLKKIDSITNGSDYLRYEYNFKIHPSSDNIPLAFIKRAKSAAAAVPMVVGERRGYVGESVRTNINAASPDIKRKNDDSSAPFIPKNADRDTDIGEQLNPSGGMDEFIKEITADVADDIVIDSAERDRILGMFDETQRKVYSAIPETGTVSSDKIITSSGCPAADVMSSLTILELLGTIRSLPGDLYKRLI